MTCNSSGIIIVCLSTYHYFTYHYYLLYFYLLPIQIVKSELFFTFTAGCVTKSTIVNCDISGNIIFVRTHIIHIISVAV